MNRLFGSRMELPVGLQANEESLSDLKERFSFLMSCQEPRRVRIRAVQEMKPANLFGLFSLGYVRNRLSSISLHSDLQGC